MSSNGKNQALAIPQEPLPKGMRFQFVEEETAEEFFGMRLVPGKPEDPVRLVALGRESVYPHTAVVYHDSPDDFAWAMKRMKNFRFLVRRVSVPHKALKTALSTSRSMTTSPKHHTFIDNMSSYFLPKEGIEDGRRDVFMWGYNAKDRRIIPVTNEQTAALGGIIPNRLQFGQLLYAALRHLPVNLRGELMQPLAYAVSFQPSENGRKGVDNGVSYLSDTLIFDGNAYRFYVLKTYNPGSDDAYTIGELMKMKLDLLWCSEITPYPEGHHWWASVVARAKSPIVRTEEPARVPKGLFGKLLGWLYRRKKRIRLEFPGFEPIEEQLEGLVRFTPVTGEAVKKVRKAFTPGSEETLELGYGWHIQTNPDILLEELASHMAEVGDPEATLIVGNKFRTNKLFGLNASRFWTWLLCGETDSGKTTLLHSFIKQIGPYGLLVLLTAGVDEGGPVFVMEEGGYTIYISTRPDGNIEVPEWAKQFGDHFIMLNLPDPATKAELEAQFVTDAQKMDELVDMFAALVEEKGPQGILPVCIQIGGEDVRAYMAALNFTKSFELKVQRPLYTRSRIRTWKGYDGLGSLPEPVWHVTFHELKQAVGDAWRGYIGRDIRDCRKWGENVFATSLTAEELRDPASRWEAGFYQLWTVHIDLTLESRIVTVYSPRQDKVLGKNIDVTLPLRGVVDYIGQRFMMKARR